MKKPAIPRLASGNAKVDAFAEAVKQTLDSQTGQQQAGKLKPLAATATLAEVIAAYNQLLERVQGS